MSLQVGDIFPYRSRSNWANISWIGEHAKDELRICIDALFITNPDIDKQEILDSTGGIVEGTCEWIRSEDKYRMWLESEESELLCISGAPGTGKTMLSIFLVRELQSLTQISSGSLVYHFCNRHDPRRNTATSVLRTWLHDIFTRNPALAKHAAKCMIPTGRMEYALGSLGTLWQIFAHTLNDPDLGPLYCVLDGLDECPEGDKKWLVGKIQTLFENRTGACHQSPNISKIVILSGGIEGVRGSHCLNLDQCSGSLQRVVQPNLFYELDYLEHRPDDIALVIKTRLSNHPKVEEFDESLWRDLGLELYKRSEGLFSWTGCMLDELASKKSKSEMLKTLDKAPSGLGPVYSRLLSQIGDESRQEIARMVRWMALTQEPFTARQLSTALYPDKKHPEEVDEACERIQDLVTQYYPLMKITKEGWGGCPTNDDSNYIVLFHRSMADYLLKIDINDADVDPKIKAFHITPEKAHYEIAKRCLDDLHAWYERTNGIYHGSDFNWKTSTPSFTVWLRYARSHWPTHARLCGEESMKFIKPRHAFFEDGSTSRTVWWLGYDPEGVFEDHERWAARRISSMFGALHICSALGLLPMIRTLLEESLDVEDYVNLYQSDSHTALAYATQYEQSEAAELLVRNGASLVNDEQERIAYLTVECPLVNAFRNGNERLARLFLKLALAKMKDSPEDRRLASFNLICEAPNKVFVLLVLDNMKSEDINMEFGNILSEALTWHPRRVKKLKWLCRRVLSSSCKVWRKDDSKHETFLNVVYFVAQYPDVVERPYRIVRRFLHDGADVNEACTTCGSTALHIVAAYGRDHESAVKLAEDLLARGAQLNAVTKRYKDCNRMLCHFPHHTCDEALTARDLTASEELINYHKLSNVAM
ncbi:hypothetical protein CFIO01_10311 [Colletotrichum fioriniae PJ7]|uniref:Nephrocystin 3-like N-terminal domain-containing protein n=1 Tax=Colletotrichum fioriniae PJ7 TaxID=1445577 RepID=A0A010S9T8_9PEZI|nr:hypothetical protein CFIO01_10311 [Colletotrichum fioriniae PJ7]